MFYFLFWCSRPYRWKYVLMDRDGGVLIIDDRQEVVKFIVFRLVLYPPLSLGWSCTLHHS